jgi:hypothetical protein
MNTARPLLVSFAEAGFQLGNLPTEEIAALVRDGELVSVAIRGQVFITFESLVRLTRRARRQSSRDARVAGLTEHTPPRRGCTRSREKQEGRIQMDTLAEERAKTKSLLPRTSKAVESRSCDVRKSQHLFAPSRTRTHRECILSLLRERGTCGVLASELYDAPELYGRSPRNRISELRKDGFGAEGEARGASDWHYSLVQDKARVAEPSEHWQDRPRTTGLPLFESAQR